MDADLKLLTEPPVTLLVHPRGYIETAQARILRERIKEIEKQGIRRIIFDLTDVQFISSTGLSFMVTYAASKREEWGPEPVVLVNPSPTVRETIKILGIESLFVIEKDIRSAFARYGIEETESESR
jgi:anti-anti-sigma factor